MSYVYAALPELPAYPSSWRFETEAERGRGGRDGKEERGGVGMVSEEEKRGGGGGREELSEEEKRGGELEALCKRCGAHYLRSQATDQSCRVHTGHYFDARASVWTCCKQLLRESEGCTPVPHEENVEARRELLKYLAMTRKAEEERRRKNGGMEDSNGYISMDVPSLPAPRIIHSETQPKDGFIVHRIGDKETLEGVCVRYDITQDELKKANRGLTSFSFPSFRRLLIPIRETDVIMHVPLSEEELMKLERQKMINKFRSQFHTSLQVAKSYLSSNDYQYDLAVKEMKEDEEFERSQLTVKGEKGLGKGDASLSLLPSSSHSPIASSSSSSSSSPYVFASRSTKFTAIN